MYFLLGLILGLLDCPALSGNESLSAMYLGSRFKMDSLRGVTKTARGAISAWTNQRSFEFSQPAFSTSSSNMSKSPGFQSIGSHV